MIFYAYVKHSDSERYLSVESGNVTVNNKWDIWHFIRNNDTSYTIEWKRLGWYLNAEADGNSDWTNVNITGSKGGNTQNGIFMVVMAIMFLCRKAQIVESWILKTAVQDLGRIFKYLVTI